MSLSERALQKFANFCDRQKQKSQPVYPERTAKICDEVVKMYNPASRLLSFNQNMVKKIVKSDEQIVYENMIVDLVEKGSIERLLWVRENINNPELSKEMLLELVNESKGIFLLLHDDELSHEICQKAFDKHADFLQFIPKEFQNDAMLGILPFNEMPEHLKTPELCLQNVRENPANLQYVPNALKTPELLTVALELDHTSLQYIPEELKTPELLKVAFASMKKTK